MQLSHSYSRKTLGFTFAEVCVAIAIAVMFGAAAFATNNRLLIALRDQREQTAATMMLQERMEKFRSFAYSNIGDQTYVSTNILGTTTTSEAALGNLTEYITVNGYQKSDNTNANGNDYNRWQRDSSHSTGLSLHTTEHTLTGTGGLYDLLKVDIVITWTGAGGKVHTRELASYFGKGNIGQ